MFNYRNNNLLPMKFNKFRKNDTNSVYIFTNARDEPNIAEWIAHHLLLGFDKVFVFDHLSKESIQSKLGTNFNNKVNIRRVDGSGNIKLKLMKEAVEIADKEEASWMLYLDSDEFLNLNKHKNVKEYLLNFVEADSVGVNWLMFGSSGYVEQPSGLITENFIRSEIRLDKHVKSFVRPSQVMTVVNPHWFYIQNKNRYYSCNGTRMAIGPFNNQPLPFIKASAYIAHYVIQSEHEYRRRKGRQMDDGSAARVTDTSDVNKMYNNVTNNQMQNKYSKRIKEFLKGHNIVL
jgi:hypothetical protein